MISFSPIHARRLQVRLRELTIGDEIALCHLPEESHEKALTEFLLRAVESAGTPSARHVADPRAWTISERLMVLAHYCSHTRDDGPDYTVTEASKLSDYLDFARDLPAQPATFEAIEDKWVLQPLTGAMAEAIETLQIDSDLKGREHWMIGFMAAQLLREGETCPDPAAESTEYIDWLASRMTVIKGLPASSMQSLYVAYRAAQEHDTQFFRIWFDESGIIVLPKEAGDAVPPARFLVLAGISELALSLTGKS